MRERIHPPLAACVLLAFLSFPCAESGSLALNAPLMAQEAAVAADAANPAENGEIENGELAPDREHPPTAEEIAAAVEALARRAASDAGRRRPGAGEGTGEGAGEGAGGFAAMWNTLIRGGPQTLAAIEAQLARMRAEEGEHAEEHAGRFGLLAANVYYQIEGLDAAGHIGDLWRDAGSAARARSARLVYGPAYQAATSGDERSASMFGILLTDSHDGVRFGRGPEQPVFNWPDTHVVLWAAGGPEAERFLIDNILRFADENEINEGEAISSGVDADTVFASAAWVAARQAMPEALPFIRRLAVRENAGPAKLAAISALGVYGHPDDFALLREGLQSAVALAADHADRATLVGAYVDALAEFGDLRAAEDLIALLRGHDLRLRDHARTLLVYMLTPDGLAAMRETVADLTGPDRARADLSIAFLFNSMGIPANEYDEASDTAKEATLASYRHYMQEAYHPDFNEDDWPEDFDGSDRGQALRTLLSEVVMQGTLALDDEYSWVRPRHFIALAQADDRELFLVARQALARRIGPDTLADLNVLSSILTRLTRSTYRDPVGIGDIVTAR